MTGAVESERMPPLHVEQMTSAQLEAKADLLSGPRNSLAGPFHPWLRSPGAAITLGRLGQFLRYESALPLDLNELAIMVTARHWDSQFEWFAHFGMATAAGIKPEILEAIRFGREPEGMSERESAVYHFCVQLRRDKRVDDSAYSDLVEIVGEEGVIDLIALLGLYDTVAMTLVVAGVPLPEGVDPPLAPLDDVS